MKCFPWIEDFITLIFRYFLQLEDQNYLKKQKKRKQILAKDVKPRRFDHMITKLGTNLMWWVNVLSQLPQINLQCTAALCLSFLWMINPYLWQKFANFDFLCSLLWNCCLLYSGHFTWIQPMKIFSQSLSPFQLTKLFVHSRGLSSLFYLQNWWQI